MSTTLKGRYQLAREIGPGGTERVFQAVDMTTGHLVAARILAAGSDLTTRDLHRFQQEGAILSALKHPNIAEVYDVFLEENAGCIIMEILESRPLSLILRVEVFLSLKRTAILARQITSALAYAHSRGIVHRDLNLDNIMVSSDDYVKITDFGIARVLHPGATLDTAAGVVIVAPFFTAPEQIEGRHVDGRTDIYSLGAILYQMVTGHSVFEGDDPLTIAFKHVHRAPISPKEINPTLPELWNEVILKALAKDPADRFQTVTELMAALGSLCSSCGKEVGFELKFCPFCGAHMLASPQNAGDAQQEPPTSYFPESTDRPNTDERGATMSFPWLVVSGPPDISQPGSTPIRPSEAIPPWADRGPDEAEQPGDPYAASSRPVDHVSVASEPVPSVWPTALPEHFCPDCGREVRPQAKFCTICGTSLGQPGISSVQFSAYYPREVTPDTWHPFHAYVFRAFAAAVVESDAAEVLGTLRESYRSEQQPSRQSIPEGALITATPWLDGFQFIPPRIGVGLFDDWHRLDFKIMADRTHLGRASNGVLTFTVEGVTVADIPLSIYVGERTALVEQQDNARTPYQAIFCSYSHRDEHIVTRLERAYRALGWDYLRDATTLRSGQGWNEELLGMIERSDVFQLFWSPNAARSEYVAKEWRKALQLRRDGTSFIRPVYWSKPMAAPPQELSHIHFWYDPDLAGKKSLLSGLLPWRWDR